MTQPDTHHLDQAKDAADDLRRFLDSIDPESDDPEERHGNEERAEELAGQVVSGVKAHNDTVAEKELREA